MATPTRDQVIDSLRTVNDPELHQDLVSLEMVKDVVVADGKVHVHVELTTPACPLKAQIEQDVRAAVEQVDGVTEANVEFSAKVRGMPKPLEAMPGVKNVLAVGAGKGGVGKSTAAVLLAVGLARSGASVGLLDADVYGPSIPTLMGVADRRPEVRDERFLPIEADGVKVMSVGFLVPPEQAVIWRGPMVHSLVGQFLNQVEWGELDYLVIDLPPGTGDAPLSLAQAIPMTGAVIVCTPQDLALADAHRAVKMYAQLKVDCLGIIENMSYYLCPKCGHRDEVFDHGGAQKAAGELGVPFLGAIPLNSAIRRVGDEGRPRDYWADTEPAVREAVDSVVGSVAAQISMKNAASPAECENAAHPA